MSISNDWFVAVFKCKPENIKKILVEFYMFVNDLEGVQNTHFLVKDRVHKDVIFSFRVRVKPKFKELIKSKAKYKLGTMLTEDKFAIDPKVESELAQYVAWDPESRMANSGQDKFEQFTCFLKNISALVVEVIAKDCFDSSDRVELAHMASAIFGCTEYGSLSTSGMEIGYYDRLTDKYCVYLKQDFKEPS